MPNNLALQLCAVQTEGKEQEEAQGAGAMLHAGEEKCKRMRFSVILGTHSGAAAELSVKTR